LSYLCPLAGGILSEGDFVQGDFVRFPSSTTSGGKKPACHKVTCKNQ